MEKKTFFYVTVIVLSFIDCGDDGKLVRSNRSKKYFDQFCFLDCLSILKQGHKISNILKGVPYIYNFILILS